MKYKCWYRLWCIMYSSLSSHLHKCMPLFSIYTAKTFSENLRIYLSFYSRRQITFFFFHHLRILDCMKADNMTFLYSDNLHFYLLFINYFSNTTAFLPLTISWEFIFGQVWFLLKRFQCSVDAYTSGKWRPCHHRLASATEG